MVLLTGLLTILKINHQIDWSWGWVLSPLWLPPLVGFAVVVVGFTIGVLVFVIVTVIVAAITGGRVDFTFRSPKFFNNWRERRAAQKRDKAAAWLERFHR